MQADGQSPVIVEHDGFVTRLVLNRPARGNALGPDMVAALNAGLSEAVRAGSRLLVLQGAGRHFFTGFDLGGLETLSDAALLERFVHVSTRRKPRQRASGSICWPDTWTSHRPLCCRPG